MANNKTKVSPYIKLSKAIVFDPRINPSQKLLYCILFSMANGKTLKSTALPSQKTIGHMMGRGRGSIRLNSKALENIGVIKIVLTKHNPLTGKEKVAWSNQYELQPLSRVYGDKHNWNTKQWIKFLANGGQITELPIGQEMDHWQVQKNALKDKLYINDEKDKDKQINEESSVIALKGEKRLKEEIAIKENSMNLSNLFKVRLKEDSLEVLNLPESFELKTIRDLLKLRGEHIESDLCFFTDNWKGYYVKKYKSLGNHPLSIKTLASNWRDTLLMNLDSDKMEAEEFSNHSRRWHPQYRAPTKQVEND
jgi:hypothetical protein